ncbi:MAG: transglycosylase SLT domain-containing protein [Oscillospiraceae bacterium]|nr:transglycosylase SLT domain-containing protein [Oscillospiraceae bacterium]
MRRKKNKGKIRLSLIVISILLLMLFVGSILTIRHYFPLKYLPLIYTYAEKHNLRPELVCAVIHAESRFDPNAVSSVGASGLMQIMESTAYWIAPKSDLTTFDYESIFDPETNISLGCFYLRMLEDQYGEMDVALAAYNAGSGNVSMWLNDPLYSSDGKTLDYIPFEETRNYVAKIARNERIYEVLLKYFSGH